MEQQGFKNHSRYVPGFHGATFAIILGALGVGIAIAVKSGFSLEAIFALLTAIALVLLFFYTRTFATGNQDRIVRAEENFRCFRLTGKPLDDRLTKSQVIALRFAGDEEYAALMQKAIQEQLTSRQIKQAISNWRADHHRI